MPYAHLEPEQDTDLVEERVDQLMAGRQRIQELTDQFAASVIAAKDRAGLNWQRGYGDTTAWDLSARLFEFLCDEIKILDEDAAYERARADDSDSKY